mmetsp:Transcript_108152/g.312539  ORF Transcript_108152/g.312539 Transcript_108152/m.312539 type:complete len:675 (-) Transcript_108152:93-2117(-)
MGAGVCCVQKKVDFSADWLPDGGQHLFGRLGGAEEAGADASSPAMLARSLPSCVRDGTAPEHHRRPAANGSSEDIGWQIASERRHQLHEAASLLPLFYEVVAPGGDARPPLVTVVHRKTQVVRSLASYMKPQSEPAQERLRSCIESLQQLSAQCETLAKIHEVFEDFLTLHLVMERCTGGSVYERIMQKQVFTEQESAVLVKHMLEALLPLHERHLYHGCLSPESFRFSSDAPAATLKLADFGLDLKAHRWDASEHLVGGPELDVPQIPQFYETCRLVFGAPEFMPSPQIRKKVGRASGIVPLSLASDAKFANDPACADDVASHDLLDEELLAEVIDEHADWLCSQQREGAFDYTQKSAYADVWSLGAIAFLLLCGYPPFFAPSRNTILGRIQRAEVSFDPPFWSKISEDAKAFVSSCLQRSCWDRPSVSQALQHPWIHKLADSAPSGSMFTSFMLNLRRFYRTSLIENCTAQMLSSRFRREDMHNFLRRCREVDIAGNGFFTASDLKHVLQALGYADVTEEIAEKYLSNLRHPGESYIDYVAMLDAIYLRHERIFTDELWRSFQRVLMGLGHTASGEAGLLPLAELGAFLGDPIVAGLLMREIPQRAGLEEVVVCKRLRGAVHLYCGERGNIDFHNLSQVLLKAVRSFSVPRDLVFALGGGELDAVDQVSTVL